MTQASPLERFVIGSMVGDAIGLPFEGLSRKRVGAVLAGRPLRHRMLLGRGMVSDDTEHMLLTIDACRRAGDDPARFGRALAWRLRLWMLAVPPACGKATAIACLRLLVGVPPRLSGVRSAGNGPAMRSGVLGLLAGDDDQLAALVAVSSRITHTDPRAEHGALAIALAARVAAAAPDARPMVDRYQGEVERLMPEGEMRSALLGVFQSVRQGHSTRDYADQIGCRRGVSGFVMHTVPVVVHLWLGGPESFERGVREMIELGGDTDTAAALLGGLLGIAHPPPDQWIGRIADFPVTAAYARRVASGDGGPGPRLLAMPARNLFFLIVVLVHVVRRLAPPYAARSRDR